MKHSRLVTFVGLLGSIVGSLQAVDFLPLFGDASRAIGAVLAILGALAAGLGRALQHPVTERDVLLARGQMQCPRCGITLDGGAA